MTNRDERSLSARQHHSLQHHVDYAKTQASAEMYLELATNAVVLGPCWVLGDHTRVCQRCEVLCAVNTGHHQVLCSSSRTILECCMWQGFMWVTTPGRHNKM
jgi:hypothetical protein